MREACFRRAQSSAQLLPVSPTSLIYHHSSKNRVEEGTSVSYAHVFIKNGKTWVLPPREGQNLRPFWLVFFESLVCFVDFPSDAAHLALD